MAEQENMRPENRLLSRNTILLIAAFILPALLPGIFGWINCLLAIPIFCVLTTFKTGQGILLIRNSMIIAGAIGLFFQPMLPALLFSFTFVPLGYSLYSSGIKDESVSTAAAKGILILISSWVIYWGIFGVFQNMNPYSQLLLAMDSGLAQTYEVYRLQAKLAPEVLLNLEQIISELRKLIPRILPGLLGCIAVMTVWSSQIIGNSILNRIKPDSAPWPTYSQWQIPDKFIWVAIGSVIAILIGTGNLRDLGLSLILVCTLIYFFQGLAILMYLLSKWNVPGYFRIIIYMIVVVQSFGFLMLTMLGIADIWIDFRKLQQQDQQPNN